MKEIKSGFKAYEKHILIWLSLLILTGCSAVLTGFDFGNLVVIVCLMISFVQIAMIFAVFGNISFRSGMYKIFAASALALLIVITIFLINAVNV